MYFSWYLLMGLVLILMAFASRWVARMPLSFSLIYLVAGLLIGPLGLGLVDIDPVRDAARVEVLAEVTVLVSLFAVGLRLREPLAWRAWRTPVKLASLTWFGIRGIGSVYYAAYAIGHAVPREWAHDLAAATLATVAISIGVHGISATPLMRWLRR